MSISTARRVPPQPAAGRWIVVTEECVAAFGVQDKLMGRTHGTMPVVAGGAVVNDGGTVDHAWVELSVAGIATGVLLGGAVVIEQVFSLPGVGRLIVGAILRRDYPVIQGGLLLTATIFVLVNLAVDLLYAALDPRIRHGRR